MELPVLIVERANTARAQPARDAVEVEGVIADTPGHCAVARRRRPLIGLALNTQLPANAKSLGRQKNARTERYMIKFLQIAPANQ